MSEPKSMTVVEMRLAALLMDKIAQAKTSEMTACEIENYNDFLMTVEKRQQIHEFKSSHDPYGEINEARKIFEG